MKPWSLVTWMCAVLMLPQILSSQETYRDEFGSVSYSNNDGTQAFVTGWVESGEATNPSNGRIRINSNRLRFRNLDGRHISRSLDLSAASSAILSLDYDATSRGNESLIVQLWDTGSSSYQTVATINATNTGSISHSLSAGQLGASSAIRIIGSDTNWSNSEFIFLDNITFTAIIPSSNAPPVLTASGDQIYCPGSSISVVESISITDPDDTTAASVSIQISSGYVSGEDELTLTGSHPGISANWSVVEGKLTLSGPATLTAFENAIADVMYSSSAPVPTGVRDISITVGDANYLPATGHFYEFVSSPGITWTTARAAAAARTYYGLQGYLATLTSQPEADFSGSQALGVGWIGASDDATEGDWQWVTGPEAGTSFWSGGVGGTELTFAFWNANEPNDYPDGPSVPGQENFAHITDPSVTSSPGSWNDLPNAGSGGAYAPQGYVVEYGGMPGDPALNISDNTLITMDIVAPTASNPVVVDVFCTADIPVADPSVVTDAADNCTASPVVIHIGDSSDGGTNPEVITRTFRVTDASGNSLDVFQTISVYPLAISTQPADVSVLAGSNASFTASIANADMFQWQVSTNGGGSWAVVSNGPEYSGATSNTLTVLTSGIDKTGHRYRVLASNSTSVSCPEVVSSSGLLTVTPPTVITNRRITYRVNKN